MIPSRMDEQVLAVQECEDEIKIYLTRAVVEGKKREEITRGLREIIDRLLDELTSEKIKTAAAESLPRFASQVYAILQATFGGLKKAQIRAVIATANGSATDRQKRVVGDISGTMEAYQPALAYNRETAASAFARDYHNEVRHALDVVANINPRPDADRVNLRNIAEMTVRYERQTEMIEDLQEKGTDLVWIVPHANCSERCEPWQGRLYSMRGRSGNTADGIPFRPLTDATEAVQVTKSGRAYVNGCVTGYGCRHPLRPYTPGGQRPAQIPAKVVERERAIEQQQRAMERNIRKAKIRAALAAEMQDPQAAKKEKLKARALTQAYEAFSRKNGVAFIRERTRVLPGENTTTD